MKELSVGVLGAGLMGAGIAEVAARAGSDVVLVDTDPAAVAKGRARIEKSIKKSAEKGQLSADAAAAIVGRVHSASSYDALAAADLVIEAVYEDLPVKKEAFRKLDAVARPSALLATNTSGLSITEISAVTRRPENVIGLHFFYPAPRMALVEMIRGLATSDATFQKAQDFVDAVGKKAILAQDYPGFIVNRVLLPMINEAVFCVMEGAKPEDVDAGMKLGCNHPMGPLELADFVGLDVALATISGLYENLRDSKYRPCPLFVQMVKAGWLGRKTGRGFYKYA
ncbi:MAG: 3-hydroxybutyryl-CoA dehydrogenase [Rhodoplanes sp.]|uniref:3-hydroxyacyl-CoA dehydrogenase family protein n=1 Tax=Rhodoplanes sp. TaxID=1968906 RepID=UPI0017E6CC3A|nr:3-hydroxyacyl-CoA dehydrogenase NAD-binding domain-containing protein [Rhodoplanes sp.]NVO14802.1 3-hydroxybutyryl-CoA dehydrogenase [Rhodoplanes sp.]